MLGLHLSSLHDSQLEQFHIYLILAPFAAPQFNPVLAPVPLKMSNTSSSLQMISTA